MTFQHPNTIVIEFVKNRFPKRGWVLDIGSGPGANAAFFEREGWEVWTIDKSADVRAHEHGDIRYCDFSTEFDLILDCNTLCHVENPPYAKIRDWLAPKGVFFGIHPVLGTCPRVKDGKSYTRLTSEHELRDDLRNAGFKEIEIHESKYWHYGFGAYLLSWQITATK